MSGIKSFGAILSVGTHVIGGLVDANINGVNVAFIDVTAQDSADNSMEFVGGLIDGGQIDLTGNYKKADAGQGYLRGNASVTAAFLLTFSDGSSASGNVVIGGYNIGNPIDGKVGFTCPLKVTGKVTYAAS